jgi:glycerol-3-phosphate dehydrogenase (NAD(P)+)
LNELAVIGAGSWGTALAIVLAPRFQRIRLWVYESGLAARLLETRENGLYLPGFTLPAQVHVTPDLAEAVAGAPIVLTAVPSHHVCGVYSRMAQALQSACAPIFVSATKGLETETLRRMTEVIRNVLGADTRTAVISGPSFAREVARLEPTALVVASEYRTIAESLQAAFSGPSFRLYTSDDVVGVEVGGAVKNVIAIAAGVCQGLGLGSNALAALITRGLAEMTRLAVRMGAKPQTLAGLAGLGDLILTCTGELSRNRAVGIELARGRRIEEIVSSTRMVAEGVKTTSAAMELAHTHDVEMPITRKMYEMLHLGLAPRLALQQLMERSLKEE